MRNYFILLSLTLSVLISCNNQNSATNKKTTSTQAENEIEFEWKSYELDSINYEHAAMILPIHLDTINKEFKMQFDLGLNVTCIYENPLDTILSKYPQLQEHIKTRDNYEILNIKTKIDNYDSSLDSLFIYKDYGESKSYNDLSIIGSIGANEIEDKIVVIDFPNTKLKIIKDTTEINLDNFNLVPLEFRLGKIFIPISIHGIKHNYIYDTGASLAPIATTDKDFFNEATLKSTKVDTISLNSWGKLVPFAKSKITVPIQLGNFQIETDNKNIFYTDDPSIVETLNLVDAKGLIGNDFFIDDVIVIDLITNQFGIKKR